MGSNAMATIAIGLSLMFGAIYISSDSYNIVNRILTNVGVPDKHRETILSLLKLYKSETEVEKKVQDTALPAVKLLTSSDLKNYDGGPDSLGLYLAILGEIFDVEKGAQHYKPGGGYAFFTGKDATRAYITGDFTEQGLIDDVTGLDDASLLGIEDWLSFYREEYQPVGKLIGRYYDKDSNPTKELISIRERIAKSRKNKYLESIENELFPPCNSEWSQEKGSRVWCTNKSGGIDRDWVGVPRQLHKKGKDPRCVCVKNFGPPSSNVDGSKHSDRGDLDHQDLKEYPGCPANSESCQVDHP